MNLSELQEKEVIDISSGKKIGNIIDVIISKNGTIENLVLEDKRSIHKFFTNNHDDYLLNWKKILKIGDDIILVDTKKEI